MGLEMGETSRGGTRILEDASLFRAKELTLAAAHLEEAPFMEFYGDVVMGSVAPSIALIDLIYTEPFDLTPTSSPLPPSTPSFMHAFHKSLGDIRGYHPFFDPYCAYLEDVP